MAYSIDLINGRDEILPNVRLGYEIRIDCISEGIALWTMLTMTSPFRKSDLAQICTTSFRNNSDKVVGVIGPVTSAAST